MKYTISEKETSLSVHIREIFNYFPKWTTIFSDKLWKEAIASPEYKAEVERFFDGSMEIKNANEISQTLIEIGKRITTKENCLKAIFLESNDLMEDILFEYKEADKLYIYNLLVKLECNFQKIFMIVGATLDFFYNRNLLDIWDTASDISTALCLEIIDIIQQFKYKYNIQD